MDNYKAENQEQEIDLVSLFFAVAHRYKQMAAAAGDLRCVVRRLQRGEGNAEPARHR